MIRVPSPSSASTMQRFRPAVLSFHHAASSASYARAARAGAATESKPKAADEALTLTSLVKMVSKECNYETEDVKLVTDAVLSTIVAQVAAGKPVKLQGFGTFKRTETSARTGRNPATGEPLQIAAGARASFVAAKNFKDTVKEEWKSQQ